MFLKNEKGQLPLLILTQLPVGSGAYRGSPQVFTNQGSISPLCMCEVFFHDFL